MATGDNGKIFSVAPDGKGDVFYASSETHIRALALDGKGNLLAGTEPNGLVLRIPLAPRCANALANAGRWPTTPAGRAAGYVLYETARREITALVLDPSGNLYVGAIGDKTRAPQAAAATAQLGPQPPARRWRQRQPRRSSRRSRGAPPRLPAIPRSSIPLPCIASRRTARRKRCGPRREDIVYSLGSAQDGKLLLGTATRAR